MSTLLNWAVHGLFVCAIAFFLFVLAGIFGAWK